MFHINLIPLVLNILNHEIFSLHKKEEYTPLRSLKNESKGLTNLEGGDDKGNERKEINEGGKRDGIPDDILEFRGRVPRGGGGGGGGKSIG